MRLLITGAAGGIGAAVTRLFAERGADVIAHDLNPPSDTERSSSITWLTGDLTLDQDRQSLAAKVGDRLDAVIAAHGIDASGALATLSACQIEKAIAVNTTSVLDLFRSLQARLERNHGRFVVVASQAGLRPEPNNALYCYTKAVLVGWAQSYAATNPDSAIRLRALAPGCTETPLLFSAQERFAAATGVPLSEFLAHRRGAIPIGRFATVQETAAAAGYLAEAGPRPVVLVESGGETLV